MSARKIYANRGKLNFVFSPCWSPNMLPWCNFTPCLKEHVQNNSESVLVSLTFWIFHGIHTCVPLHILSSLRGGSVSSGWALHYYWLLGLQKAKETWLGKKNKKQENDEPNFGDKLAALILCRRRGDNPVFSQKPKFPASVLLGVRFGLAFWGGGEGLLGIRQGSEVGVVRRAQPLHQWLQLVLLLLEV